MITKRMEKNLEGIISQMRCFVFLNQQSYPYARKRHCQRLDSCKDNERKSFKTNKMFHMNIRLWHLNDDNIDEVLRVI